MDIDWTTSKAQGSTISSNKSFFELGAQIKTWLSMESYATQVNVSGRSRENKKALEQLAKTIKLVDGRYEVGLPRVEDNATIQNIFFRAHSQFASLERRLGKDESLKQ